MEGITIVEAHIDVTESEYSCTVDIENPEVLQILGKMSQDERSDYLKRALHVGIIALQGMETRLHVDFVRGEFERMQTEIETEFEKVFADKGLLLLSLDRYLGEKGELKRSLDAHFGEQGSVIFKILNPDDETTPLGKFRKQIQLELDVNREGTAFHKLSTAMESGFKEVLIALRAAEAVEEERDKGTAKGGDLEDYVFEELSRISRPFEDTVEHVGREKGPLGDVGDVLIRINPADTGTLARSIIVEVKNRSVAMRGKSDFRKELKRAKENRNAHYAIGAVQASKIPTECGCWRGYDGDYSICAVSIDEEPLALEVAYKMARMIVRLSALKDEVKFDSSQFKAKIKEIEGQLDVFGAVKRNLSGATKQIDNAQSDMKAMESSIRDILSDILGMITKQNDE